jgi:hypothetical protein
MSDEPRKIAPCRACGSEARESTFEAPSNSFLARVQWTRIECRGHPYVLVNVEAESRGEAVNVWNAIMQGSSK